LFRTEISNTCWILARRALAFNVLFLASAAVGAQLMRVADIADLSIEELGNIQITSVSRHAERLADAPASIFVITGEDIRRSGATRLAEALRLAPNLEVARINASSYAISARGFNQPNAIANKLLVLIDGRTVYTPLFSGVFWDAQDVMLEDVERIEVISGPGATLWGANAVNGVINVITRRASDTQGVFAYGRAGNLERGYGARYGAAEGNVSYRAYGRVFDIFNTSTANGTAIGDGWSKGQVGFRADWGTAANGFTLQGDGYRGSLDQLTDQNAHISGANLLGRWNRDLAGWGSLQVQANVDQTERDIPGVFGEHLNIFDFEFLHGLKAVGRHRLTWGGGYRYGYDHVTSNAVLAFLPANRDLRWANVFAQDEIALEENLRLTLGAKFQNNYYTGTEPLPSARLAWKPDPQRLVWGAVSRAVRAPSRVDRDLFVPARTIPPTAPALDGGPDFVSEIVKVFELGYRAQPSTTTTYSVSLFHNIYDKLRSVEPVSATSSVFGNKMKGTANGLEAWGSYQAARNWRLSAGAFFLRQHLSLKPDSGDTNVNAAGNDPAHQWLLRSSFDLPNRTELDIGVRRVGSLPNPSVPAYTAADIRIAWRLHRELEVSVVGQNLLDSGHVEFGNPVTGSEMARGAYVKLKWTY
jgi:iron complex outermembrane receptor protein